MFDLLKIAIDSAMSSGAKYSDGEYSFPNLEVLQLKMVRSKILTSRKKLA